MPQSHRLIEPLSSAVIFSDPVQREQVSFDPDSSLTAPARFDVQHNSLSGLAGQQTTSRQSRLGFLSAFVHSRELRQRIKQAARLEGPRLA